MGELNSCGPVELLRGQGFQTRLSVMVTLGTKLPGSGWWYFRRAGSVSARTRGEADIHVPDQSWPGDPVSVCFALPIPIRRTPVESEYPRR